MAGAHAYESSLLRRRRSVVVLPENDATIDDTPAALRHEVAQSWERRAHEELKVAAAFSVLCRELLETRADPLVLGPVSRAVHDEVRHAEVCRALAARYRGADVPWPAEVVIEPSPAGAERLLRTTFHVVSMCCVNEAIASTFLHASLEGARSPSARAAVGELLADEVEHARIGWLFLARQSQSMLAVIEQNLLVLSQAVFRCWWDAHQLTLVQGAPEHGLPSLEATRECALRAMREIVAPGFAELGLDAQPVLRWIESAS